MRADVDPTNADQAIVRDGAANRQNRLPPIRILDLLLLTASVAFVLMIQDRARRGGEFPATQPVYDFAFQFVYAIASGVALASVYWLLVQKRMTGRFFHMPGHWFLGAYALSTCGGLLVYCLLATVDDDSAMDQSSTWQMGLLAASEIVVSLFLCRAAMGQSGVWRGLTFALGLTFFLGGLSYYLLSYHYYLIGPSGGIGQTVQFWMRAVDAAMTAGNCLVLVLWVVVVVGDVRKKNTRDWLHWLGVGSVVVHSAMLPLMTWILSYLISRIGSPAEFP